jgi:formate hydrogenlyase transcriptional activator
MGKAIEFHIPSNFSPRWIRSTGPAFGIPGEVEEVSTRLGSDKVEVHAECSIPIIFPLQNTSDPEPATHSNFQSPQQPISLQDEIAPEKDFPNIIGNSPRLREVIEDIRIVAPADSSVLIHGETGTGKELIAHAIHDLSPRKSYPFIKVNCSAIPTGLLESELFGHERGAFTGAIAQKIGRFELANKGTLFLDEIGDIPLELQPKLLRVLQEQEFERLGSTCTQRVNVRVLAATNADLTAMVAEKRFRSDLYYRLNVFPIAVPSLRERPEDVPLLVRYFVRMHARRMGKHLESIPKEVMDALVRYSWPGNVRELQNLVERSVLISPVSLLRVPLAEISDTAVNAAGGRNKLEQTERELVLKALRESDWVVGGPRGAATRLGLNRTTLVYKMKKFGIAHTQTRNPRWKLGGVNKDLAV